MADYKITMMVKGMFKSDLVSDVIQAESKEDAMTKGMQMFGLGDPRVTVIDAEEVTSD